MVFEVPIVSTSTQRYMSGLALTWLSDNLINIESGHCNDSSGIIDMNYPENIILNTSTIGLGGVEETIQNNSLYAIYMIGDQYNRVLPNVMARRISNNTTLLPETPIVYPENYNVSRLRSYFRTDGLARISAFVTTDSVGEVGTFWMYYRESQNILGGGNATSFTLLNCLPSVPPINCEVLIGYNYLPAVTGNAFQLRRFGSTETTNAPKFTGIKNGTFPNYKQCQFPSWFNGSVGIEYRVNAGDSLALNIRGYQITV